MKPQASGRSAARPGWRRRATPWIVALLVLAIACAGATQTGTGDAAALEGTWHYTGVQTSGNRISYDGTVTITQTEGADFSGGLNAESSTPQGAVVQVNGVITGRMNGNTVDFDLQLGDEVRRHVGTVSASGDSITGSWANQDVTAIGSFTLARQP